MTAEVTIYPFEKIGGHLLLIFCLVIAGWIRANPRLAPRKSYDLRGRYASGRLGSKRIAIGSLFGSLRQWSLTAPLAPPSWS